MPDGDRSVRLHRVLRAPPDRVYRALLDPATLVKWLPPDGFIGTAHHSDVRVGGGYRMSFTNVDTGTAHTFGGTYHELVHGERIRYDDRFEDPGLAGAMAVTISLRAVSVGTDRTVVQEGLPEAIPLEFCVVGWQESLSLLTRLVERAVPDG